MEVHGGELLIRLNVESLSSKDSIFFSFYRQTLDMQALLQKQVSLHLRILSLPQYPALLEAPGMFSLRLRRLAAKAHFVLSLAIARFTTQFFYSPEIFDIITENPGNGTAIAQFITDWMKDYALIEPSMAPNELCQLLASMTFIPGFEMILNVCNFFALDDFSWAIFVQAMLNATVTTFGDTNFVECKASWDNHNLALQNTDLYIQTSLTPNSCV